MSGAILYTFRRCPYAMRGRMALHVAGIDYEHREVALRNKPQAMLDASPKGTVPVFIADNGEVIDESLDLMRWALSQSDPHSWLTGDMSEMDALIAQNDGPFKHHLDRYKYKSRYVEGTPRGEVDLTHRAEASVILSKLDARIAESGYLVGKRESLADIAIFPFIRQFAATEPDWWAQTDWPALRDWLANYLQSPLFKAIMVKHPLWNPAL
ncbi:glutathione S-transferase [Litorimonas sp. RW-G-Af-16]|uniref:glutathione S-transferase n=1 Tax=Litorimonas sp. RW-G-Af-16 TaxID=3241168 RepID=UPI00390C8401